MLQLSPGPQWGDVPTWVTAAAAIGALFAAVYAAVRTGGLLKVERERDQARIADVARAQASLIAAWEDTISTGATFDRQPYGVTVQNASDLPVWDLKVTWHSPDGQGQFRGAVSRPVVPPGIDFIHRPYELRVADKEPDPNGNAVYTEPMNGFPITITFRDSGGTWWTRDERGQLSTAASSPPIEDPPPGVIDP